MQIIQTEFHGLIEIIPDVYHDDRGYFMEFFHTKKFHDAGLPHEFVQDNQSFSRKGVVRGLHFQWPPFEQGKMVRAITGSILDVAVDIRKSSPNFGKHVKIVLESSRQNMLYIPPGFAHGFVALEDAIFQYKCTSYYQPDADGGIAWNDPELDIQWNIQNPLISEKDAALPSFSDYKRNIGLT
jgi:dTDP-4-dehydrorhamnose 3,5-epimerase